MERRDFLRRSLGVSAGAAFVSHEERALAAQLAANAPEAAAVAPGAGGMPMGKLGELEVSRLIIGGNLISGFAHSRDLIYVSSLVRNYFTDDKVLETLQLAEKHGVNTAILRMDEHTVRIINRYWRENRGNMQWIAQIKVADGDYATNVRRAVDTGATGLYIQGESCDHYVEQGKLKALAKAYELMQATGVVAGIGAHSAAVLHACRKEGLKPDFFMKTFNSKGYWSARIAEDHDNVWEEAPAETAAFFQDCETPWIAFKVLGAGAIAPAEGFRYAFENGADFICVGMFDFQIEEDARLAREIAGGTLQRARAWMA